MNDALIRETKLEEEQQQQLTTPPKILRDDPKFASGKVAFFQYLTIAVFLFLVAGFWDLQIRNPEVYHQRAEQNRIKSTPILAARGKILDRDGRVIVDSHSSYSAILSRENLVDEHLQPIAEGLNMDYEQLRTRVARFNAPKYQPIVIKDELTPGELAFVQSHRDQDTFPELDVITTQRRLYPKDGLAAHVLGYVGEISDAELNSADLAKFHQGDIIGKEGIEREYNDVLMGVDGQRQVEVDNLGNEKRVLDTKPDVPGKDLQLTIDLDLQVVAELAMEDKRGAVVALDPRNGEVLAMVSRPAYDPNLFATRIKNKDWNALVKDPNHPLLNRAIQAQLAPGSTFKPIVALAGLETGTIDEDYSVVCTGGASFYGGYHKCDKVHGRVTLHTAIVGSCDVYFYNVGNKLGIDRIAQYAEIAGIGHRTGIDLPHEAEGLMPSTKWKMRTSREKWFAGETISVAIGQGAVTETPLQVAVAIGGLSLGGIWNTPHLVRDTPRLPQARRADLNLDNVEKIVSGMYGVVNEGGTGFGAKLPGIRVCGKTGTAQLASNKFLKGTKVGQTMKDNGWFVAFAPQEAPEIVIAVLSENGGWGSDQTPVVRDVMKAYFDKKARLELERAQVSTLQRFESHPQLLPVARARVN